MKKVLKETMRTAKELQRKGIIYLDGSTDLGAQVNYEVIAAMVEDLNIFMEAEKYETLKNDKEKLLHEIAISTFSKDDLIYNFSDDFKMAIIKEFINLNNPELIWGTYCFITKYGKLQELYQKASIQKNKESIRACGMFV